MSIFKTLDNELQWIMRLNLAAVENAWTAILLPQLDVNLKRKTLFWHQLGPDISGVCVSKKTDHFLVLSPYRCCNVFLS